MVKKSNKRLQLKRLYNDIARLENKRNNLNAKIESKLLKIQTAVGQKKVYKQKYNNSQNPHELDRIMSRLARIDDDNRRKGHYIHNNKLIIRKLETALSNKKWKIRAPRVSNLKKIVKNGYFIRNQIYPTMLVSDASIPDIKAMIKRKYSNSLELLSNKRRKYYLEIGSNTVKNIRLVFCDEYGDNISSTNVNSIHLVEEKLNFEMNKHNASGTNKDGKNVDPYDRYLMAVDFFIYNSKNKTGCAKDRKPQMIFPLNVNEMIKLYCPKSKDNRCFDMCLIAGKTFSSNGLCKRRAHRIRKKLNIGTTKKIDPKTDEAHKIADEIGVSYRVYHGIRLPNRMSGDSIDKSFKIYAEHGEQNEKTVWILKIAGHCYLIKNKNIFTVKCTKCGAFRKRGLSLKHKCTSYEMSYYQNKICRNPVLQAQTLKKDNKKRYVFFDLETLPCGKGDTHCVYAVGWFDTTENKYFSTYGKNSMKDFMKWVFEQTDKTFIAYNGCRFDFYFLQKEILNNNLKPKFLMNNGRILSLKWGGENKISKKTKKQITINQNCVWDLCNFMPGFSLKKACQSFETNFQKQDFDHNLMKDWDCVDKHKKDVLHYLKYDVMSLKELTEKYVATAETLYDASPTRYLTLSSYADKVWASTVDDEIIEIPDMEKQKFIRKSIYGGRTYPSRKRFESKMYKNIKSNKSNATKLKQMYKILKKSGDYIFNGDINSQYPACMAGCELMPTLFPTGRSAWKDADECERIFNEGKQLGVFEIEFTCPNKKILHPILPRKKLHIQKSGKAVSTGVSWSLLNGKGVYNTADIQNAIKFGYEIKFVGRGLVWEGVSDSIFQTYIHLVYKHKVEASIEENKVKRQIAKLMMNSLYGKTLQNPVNKSECIAHTVDDVEKFLIEHVLTDWETVYHDEDTIDYILLTGEKIKEEKIAKKPCQLGTFILGYSRRLWMMFLETIDPTLESQITTYQDTDSLHIMGKNYDKLVNAGMIDENKLGFLSNDCDDQALIIKEINLAPKCYLYECLTQNGEIKQVMKSKGIMKKKLREEGFENEQSYPVEWTGMKKVNKRISKNDKANGVEHFQIKKQTYSRTFYKNKWSGMTFNNNHYYPFGYEIA